MMEQEVETNSDADLIVRTLKLDLRKIMNSATLFMSLIAITLSIATFVMSHRMKYAMQPLAMVNVQPLFGYGDTVQIVAGSHMGLTGVVIKWDEVTCEYTILVPSQQHPNVLHLECVRNVREDQLERMQPLDTSDPPDPDDRTKT